MNLTPEEVDEILKRPGYSVAKSSSPLKSDNSGTSGPPKQNKYRVAAKETEADFASWFEDYLHLKGYQFAHFRPARVMRHGKEIYETPVSGDAAGFEDYFVWHEIKQIYFLVEIKSETGKLSEKQEAIIESHRKAGLHVFVWRPSDRDSIIKLLKE